MSATALHRFTSLKANFSFCFRRVYKLTMFLVSVDSDTINQIGTLTRTKQSVSTRTKSQFHAAVTPLPRSDDAAPTPLPCSCDAPPTQHSDSDDAALLHLPCSCDVPPSPSSGSDDEAQQQC